MRFSLKKRFFEKFLEKVEFIIKISNSSENFDFQAMNKPKKLQLDCLTNYTFY
eukprot:UN02347